MHHLKAREKVLLASSKVSELPTLPTCLVYQEPAEGPPQYSDQRLSRPRVRGIGELIMYGIKHLSDKIVRSSIALPFRREIYALIKFMILFLERKLLPLCTKLASINMVPRE